MSSTSYMPIAFVIGVIYSLYLPMNSSLSKHLGSPLAANIIFFSIALATTFILFCMSGLSRFISNIKTIPPYLYIPGVLSAFIILGLTFLIPIIGPRKTFIISISGQVLTAMIVGHFGLFNLPNDPLTFKKCIGALFLIMGVVLTAKS